MRDNEKYTEGRNKYFANQRRVNHYFVTGGMKIGTLCEKTNILCINEAKTNSLRTEGRRKKYFMIKLEGKKERSELKGRILFSNREMRKEILGEQTSKVGLSLNIH